MKICKDKKHLEKKCIDIESIEEGLYVAQAMIMHCITSTYKNDVIGLANNQVWGRYNIFIANLNGKWRSFINPIIMNKKHPISCVESCMSFPNKENKVKRYKDIILQHYTKNGMIIEKFNGGNAQIIQHEVDHLNGIHIFNK